MKKKFDIQGMSCAACQAHVTNAIRKTPGVTDVSVNLLQNSAVVVFDEGTCTPEDIEKAVKEAGYGASPAVARKEKEKKEKDKDLIRLVSSLIILLVLMYFSMGHMMWNWPVPEFLSMKSHPFWFAFTQLVLTVPIIAINFRYFLSGFRKLFRGHPNMDSLIAVGSTASFLYGIFSLVMIAVGESTGNSSLAERYHMNLYFESAGMILVFVSIGKYLEKLSTRKTTNALTSLMDMSPKTAVVLKDGEEVKVAVEEVNQGDVVVVRKGDSVPVDGIIVEGNASIDQSNITGESVPVYKNPGDEVFSSTIVTAGYLKAKATKVGEDTSFANIIRLVEEAANSKAPVSRLADRISGIFVPVIFLIAILVFFGNLIYISIAHPDYVEISAFETSLNFAITVIVIACPCALGLATPVAIMVGTGKGAQNGLLIKNAEILEKAHQITTVVMDKTGTITEGCPRVTDFENYGKTDLNPVLFALESKSEHPLASAITEYALPGKGGGLSVTDYRSMDGYGITGNINGDSYYIGNSRYPEEKGIHDERAEKFIQERSMEGKTVLVILKNGTYIGLMAVRDNVKPTSKEAVSLLKRQGIRTVMLTGDNHSVAENIGKEVGVDQIISDVRPEDKQQVIASLKSDSRHLVAMVGDGVNDAPALTSADLGIAVGSGSDVALESSDIVLLRNDLVDVVNVISLSRRTLRTIKIDLFWAFFYNAVCVLLSTGLFYYLSGGAFKMQPMYGSIAMSISSVSVVLNALTINFFRPKKAEEPRNGEIALPVKGMMCSNCVRHVEEACLSVPGITSAKASLEKKNVTLVSDGTADLGAVISKIKEAGYKAKCPSGKRR